MSLRQRRVGSDPGLPTNLPGSGDGNDDDIQPSEGWSVFFKIVFFVFIILPSLAVAAFVLFVESPIDPAPVFDGLKPPPKLEGVLKPNDLLVYQGWRFLEGQIRGPESMEYQSGYLYTGTADGKVLEIDVETQDIQTIATLGTPPCGLHEDEHHCGRPLGMRFDSDGYLIVLDAYLGMYKINVASRDVVQMLPVTTSVDGKPLHFLNDMDISKDGMIYFSTSSRFDRRGFHLDFLEGKAHGRLLRHDPVENKTEVLLDGLYFANGVQVSHDQSYVLVAETTRCRIRKYHLTGPKQGHSEIFADNLPGTIDNIRGSYGGGYWAVAGICRHADRFNLPDTLSYWPWVRKQLAKIPLSVFGSFLPRCGLIIELDKNGEVIRTLQDLDGERFAFMSEVLDDKGRLYIGSFSSPYVGVVNTFKKRI